MQDARYRIRAPNPMDAFSVTRARPSASIRYRISGPRCRVPGTHAQCLMADVHPRVPYPGSSSYGPTALLPIRKHPPGPPGIAGCHHGGMPQTPLASGRLLPQEVAPRGPVVHDLPRSGDAKPLGGRPLRLCLRHDYPSLSSAIRQYGNTAKRRSDESSACQNGMPASPFHSLRPNI
jgi:hypothetical protein